MSTSAARTLREAPELAEARDLLRRAVALLEQVAGGTGAAPSIASAGAVTVNEAMKIIGVKRTKLNELINNGLIVKIKLGRRTLLSRASIEKLLHDSVVLS